MLDRSHFQRLRTCVPYAITLSMPAFLESDSYPLNSNPLSLLSQHQSNQVVMCSSGQQLKYLCISLSSLRSKDWVVASCWPVPEVCVGTVHVDGISAATDHFFNLKKAWTIRNNILVATKRTRSVSGVVTRCAKSLKFSNATVIILEGKEGVFPMGWLSEGKRQ